MIICSCNKDLDLENISMICNVVNCSLHEIGFELLKYDPEERRQHLIQYIVHEFEHLDKIVGVKMCCMESYIDKCSVYYMELFENKYAALRRYLKKINHSLGLIQPGQISIPKTADTQHIISYNFLEYLRKLEKENLEIS